MLTINTFVKYLIHSFYIGHWWKLAEKRYTPKMGQKIRVAFC